MELKLTFLDRTRGQRNMQFTDYVLPSLYNLPPTVLLGMLRRNGMKRMNSNPSTLYGLPVSTTINIGRRV
jgi:hypothetical protein